MAKRKRKLPAGETNTNLPTDHDLARLVPDATEAEVEALQCALRAAPGFWLTQDTLQRLLTDTSRYIDTYSRALHQIERRTVSLHLAPASSRRAGPVQHLPDPARLDPWSVDPAEIEEASRVLSICPTCQGSETVPCGRCSGSARVSCGNCGGSGRVPGQRGMKNCGVCRGRGTVICGACSNGRVPCDRCGATGRVWAWLSIQQRHSSQVRVHPKSAGALVHKKIETPQDFDAGPKRWVNTLMSDTGPQEPPDDLPEELTAEVNPFTDRALSTRVQSFSSVVHRFTFEAAGATGFLEVAGTPPALSKSSNWRPLRVRQAAAAGAAMCLSFASLSLMGSYTGRHAWYAAYGHGGLIALLGSVVAALVAVVVAGLFLPRRLWSNGRLWIPLGLVGIVAVGLGLAWKYPGPSAAGARKALAEKDTTRAETEANALRELKLDWTAGSEVLDDLHIERLKAVKTFDQLVSVVGEPWNLEARRNVALRVLREIGEQKKGEFYTAKNLDGLLSLSTGLADLDPALRDDIAVHVLLVRTERCLANQDCACVVANLKTASTVEAVKSETTRLHDLAVPTFSTAIKELVTSAAPAPPRDPHERQAALKRALDLAKCYADLAGTPSDPAPPALETQLALVDREVEAADKKAAALAAIEEAKRKRQEAIEAARRKQEEAIAEAKRRQEEAIQRAREAAEESSGGGTLCADGSYSSSTGRGTCSHHGGIAGGSGRRGRRR